MNYGMLWFDNNSKDDIPAKIGRAVDYYAKKYHKTPTICFVHPSMIPAAGIQVAGIEVRGTRSILPNHFWLGVSDMKGNGI